MSTSSTGSHAPSTSPTAPRPDEDVAVGACCAAEGSAESTVRNTDDSSTGSACCGEGAAEGSTGCCDGKGAAEGSTGCCGEGARGAAEPCCAERGEGQAVVESVRAHYAAAATAVRSSLAGGTARAACCGSAASSAGEGAGAACCESPSGNATLHYGEAERALLPDGAALASLGSGNPVAEAGLREGETVVDLGSGGGIDVLLAARAVGPGGRVLGIDMTDEMLLLARGNLAEAGLANVEFRKGRIEALPVAGASVDVVISNCVINLSVDKQAVFAEIARVLRPGGRLCVSDVVAEDRLTPGERAARGSYCDCVAGALSQGEYREGLLAAGFTEVSVTPVHALADGIHSAIVRAVVPGARA